MMNSSRKYTIPVRETKPEPLRIADLFWTAGAYAAIALWLVSLVLGFVALRYVWLAPAG